MIKRIVVVFLIVALIGTLCEKSIFAQQNITVSNKTPGRNILPRLAINTFTGDILVAWTQQIPGTLNVRVWVRLLTLKSNGSYAVKKTFMASPATGYHANANVVFIPWQNKFLVFWDTFNFSEGLALSAIMGRVVKTKGKPSGKAIELVSDGMANNWPHIVVHRDPLCPLKQTNFGWRILLFP